MNSKKIMVRLAGITGLILLCSSLSGCAVTSGAAFGAASGAMAAKGVGNDFKYYVFDVPPQVVYRIDDHRFFTLENYKDCEHGGIVYYNDTNKRIKEYINGGSDSNSILKANPMMSWKGQFIYAASDNIMAFIDRYPQMSDRDTHMGTFLWYKISGREKYGKIEVAGDTDPGFETTVLVTDKDIYVKRQGIRGDVYDIYSESFNSYNGALSDSSIVENKDWPKLNTPSGAIRLTCNVSIKPVSFRITPEQIYAPDAMGTPKNE